MGDEEAPKRTTLVTEAFDVAVHRPTLVPLDYTPRARAPSSAADYRHRKEYQRVEKIAKKESVLKVFGPDISGVFKFKYLGSAALHSSDEIKQEQAIVLALDHIKKARRPPVTINLAVTSFALGMVEMPKGTVIQSAPMSSYVKCDTNKEECHLITINPRIGVAFLHVLTGKKSEVSSLSAFLAARQEDAKLRPGYDFFANDSTKGVRVLGSFDSQMLGSMHVSKKNGQVAVSVALGQLRKQLKKQPARVMEALIIATTDGLKIHDALNDEEAHISFIKNITYATVEDEGSSSEVFAYIEEDARLAVYTAYFFTCHKGAPDTICKLVGKARDILLEEEERKFGNPFHPEHDPEPVDGFCGSLEMDREKLSIVKELGAGQFGTVYLVNDATANDMMRAVKILRPNSSKTDEAMFKSEAEVMALMTHDSVVSLVGVCFAQRPWLVVIELMLYGDVRKVLQAAKSKKIALGWNEKYHMARQICSGLAFVIFRGYVHMDVAARNLLVHENSVVKIADFGCARSIDPTVGGHLLNESLRLAVRWMAPETLSKTPILFSEKTDVYAYGVVLWEIATYGVLPFGALDARTTRDQVKAGLLLDRPPSCNDFFWEIMSKCWGRTPAERPKFTDMLPKLEKAYEEAVKELGAPRDIGALVNSDFQGNVKNASRRASSRRRASVVDHSSAQAIVEPALPSIAEAAPAADAATEAQ
eukprot:m.656361 g.656361  ORF g.656361 m.656361 type:complete len:704 (+) comp58429_c0_seq2:344-2455(+)